MNEYRVISGQSLLDIAIEAYGDVEGLHWLLEDNPTLSGPSDRLRAGQVLLIRTEVVNVRFKAYLNDFAPFATVTGDDQPEGVGYWFLNEYTVQP
ncbi:LysM peptidoglycan-binding domain-containing protein [Larkinella sp. VNQ87]|uniref:LysM peptidoglycan-binding domain-containing protein n=1 Tax=Larkinella sp. VNQ87 TaxID=3400921 RepID=UPI003BFC2378